MIKNPITKVKKCLPFIVLVSEYNAEKAIADVIAGITVGLTLIPQSLAYASLAGLPPEYGLYSSLFGGFGYAVFGTVPEISIAPTALLSLLTLTYTSGAPFGNVTAAILLCLCTGIVAIICGILRLGFLIDFISTPAIAGLTSAAAILIASGQLRNLFGLPNSNSRTIFGVWKNFIQNVHKTSLNDIVLGICCCCFLLTLRKLQTWCSSSAFVQKTCGGKKCGKLRTLLWFLSVSRNAVIVVISTIVCYTLTNEKKSPFYSTSNIQPGLPDIFFLPLEITVNNKTFTIVEMTKELGSGVFVLPFIAIVANVAIAKSFFTGNVLDASQEMLVIGLCNVAGSFIGSIPVSGSFSRAAVSNASGVRTPFSGIYAGIIVLFSLTLLTEYFKFIPKAALAAVIICCVIFMVEIATFRQIWKLNKIDILPFFITFFACLLLGIEIGIMLGVLVDLLLLLFYVSRPPIAIQRVTIQGKEYVKVIPSGAIFYPTAAFFRQRIVKNELVIDKCKEGRVVIIDCSKLTKSDFTTAKCMGSLAEELQKSNKTIAFLRLPPGLSKLLAKTCRNSIFAFNDTVLFEMLKERRYSDILDSYKNIKVDSECTIDEFTIANECGTKSKFEMN